MGAGKGFKDDPRDGATGDEGGGTADRGGERGTEQQGDQDWWDDEDWGDEAWAGEDWDDENWGAEESEERGAVEQSHDGGDTTMEQPQDGTHFTTPPSTKNKKKTKLGSGLKTKKKNKPVQMVDGKTVKQLKLEVDACELSLEGSELREIEMAYKWIEEGRDDLTNDLMSALAEHRLTNIAVVPKGARLYRTCWGKVYGSRAGGWRGWGLGLGLVGWQLRLKAGGLAGWLAGWLAGCLACWSDPISRNSRGVCPRDVVQSRSGSDHNSTRFRLY